MDSWHDLKKHLMLMCPYRGARAEWHFRSSLDRYVWIHGMICAYMKPWAEGILVRIDNMALRARIAARSLLIAGANVMPPPSRSSGSSHALSGCHQASGPGVPLKAPGYRHTVPEPKSCTSDRGACQGCSVCYQMPDNKLAVKILASLAFQG
jgi:hypothetical protein